MDGKLNQLHDLLPAGLLVDAEWLQRHGYYSSLVAKYVKGRWLEQPTRGAYRRTGASLGGDAVDWQTVVLSLQRLRPALPLVGGRTALVAQGYGHGLHPSGSAQIHLYAGHPPPSWARRLLGEALVFHRARLFESDPVLLTEPSRAQLEFHVAHPARDGVAGLLQVSTLERATLEVLAGVPQVVSFSEADKLVSGLESLSPRRLSFLLAACRSVKVKRLALWFADRHGHAWAQRLNRERIDLGLGKRMLQPGGRLDRAYQITVPREIDAP
jgi:hypothetical protein